MDYFLFNFSGVQFHYTMSLCKIPAKASRKLNLNFGPFADDSVSNWVTAQTYTFTYINGARF